jgi:hypothetical protein
MKCRIFVRILDFLHSFGFLVSDFGFLLFTPTLKRPIIFLRCWPLRWRQAPIVWYYNVRIIEPCELIFVIAGGMRPTTANGSDRRFPT